MQTLKPHQYLLLLSIPGKMTAISHTKVETFYRVKKHAFSQILPDIIQKALNHTGLVTTYDDIDIGQHWLRIWLVV